MWSVSGKSVMRRGKACRHGIHGWLVASGFDDVPDAPHVVAGLVPRLGVFGPVVQRLPFHGPLLFTVIARDDGVVASCLVGVGRHQWRPVGGATAVADRF